jgi:hypothetical protein
MENEDKIPHFNIDYFEDLTGRIEHGVTHPTGWPSPPPHVYVRIVYFWQKSAPSSDAFKKRPIFCRMNDPIFAIIEQDPKKNLGSGSMFLD